MSLPSAFAAVTRSLQNLIQSVVPPTTEVTALPPPEAASSAHQSRVNLFLYRVAQVATSRNASSARGPSVAPPLELHYLVTAYGNPSNALGLTEHDLLWTAFHTFHAQPLVSVPGLGGSETVQVVSEDLSLDALSALWQATKADYRPALAYVVRLPALTASSGAARAKAGATAVHKPAARPARASKR